MALHKCRRNVRNGKYVWEKIKCGKISISLAIKKITLKEQAVIFKKANLPFIKITRGLPSWSSG